MQKRYDNYYYWEHMITNNKPVWKDCFENLSLTKNSKFIHTGIINYDKNIIEDNWACYPNAKSMLGFIQYVFIPTAFFTWLNNEFDEVVIPIASSYNILDQIKEFDKEKNEYLISNMKEDIESLNNFWTLNEEECFKSLKIFTKKFNEKWHKENKKILKLSVFQSPNEIEEYVMPENDDIFIEVLEEEIGLSKKEWQNVCKNVYHNEFVKSKFIDILNYKVGCLV
ncbi:hypothetical protein [Clostridium oceanicum]|uniref:Uncharacterized protein n=1 Tax=Clostridium oceanicum TaxID=1543 RepID=A0ABP3UJH8_9CLOT